MKKLVILFDGPHLAFSPTPIQLYDELSKTHEVTILAQNPNNFTGDEISGRNVKYHKYYAVKGRVIYKILFSILSLVNREASHFRKNKLTYRDYFFKYRFFKKNLATNQYDRILCIDIVNLFYCSLLKRRVDFLSLELTKDERLLPAIDMTLIDCVLIQSKERYAYLFKEASFRIFFIQNAPVYHEINVDVQVRKALIYGGTCIAEFGFYNCLDYLNKFTDETMVVQGAIYPNDRQRVEKEYADLLNENRLVLTTKYLDNKDVVRFIADHEIGFCFYDFAHPAIKRDHFNYFTAPSGKMFKYLAAGVPVVGSNIPGFRFVEEFKCGILVDSLGEDEIRKAVLAIRSDYTRYVENARTAAKFFSFDRTVQPYLEFINTQE